MNVAIVILSIIGILFVLWWMWYKLKDRKEGDLIETSDGLRVEYSYFALQMLIALFGLITLLLLGLLVWT